MAELKDVLGSVLRDVAHARVTSDMFSRDVSLDYARDPVLSAFPVPRLEIKEASVQLRFAINTVEQKETDRAGITRAQLGTHGTQIAREVVNDFIAGNPRAEELRKLIADKGLDLEVTLREAVEGAVAADARLVDSALAGERTALVDRINAAVSAKLLEDADIKREVTRGTGVRAVRAAMRTKVDSAVGGFVSDLTAALAAAQRQATRVDVAVTRADLASVPEPLVSQISVVLQVRNYEWSETEGAAAVPGRRLNPE